MAAKKIVARKIKGTTEPVRLGKIISPRINGFEFNSRAVCDGVEFVLAQIRRNVDFEKASDACIIVGYADLNCQAMTDCSVVFWDDKFWMFGVDRQNLYYNRNNLYALYEVQVLNPEDFFNHEGLK